jgi:hypothetical protein
MKTKKKTRPLICSTLVEEGRRADSPGGTVETSRVSITRNADGANCGYVTCAATK